METSEAEYEFSINNNLLWEMIKLKVRGVTIGYSTYKKKQREQVERDLEIKLKNKQYELNIHFSDENKLEADKLEQDLISIRQKKNQRYDCQGKS